MRRSLLPGLIEAARFNQRRGSQAIRFFEVGHVFPGSESREIESIAWVAGGQIDLPWDRANAFDLFELKGTVESLANHFEVKLLGRSTKVSGLVPGTSSELISGEDGETVIGSMGQLDSDDSAYPLFVAELNAASLRFESIRPVDIPSRYPGVEVDLTLTQSVDTPWSEISSEIRRASVEDLVSFGLKDRYSGEGVPEGAVNTTIYFFYNAVGNSLTRDQVNERHEAVRQLLEQRFGWKGKQ